MCGLVLVITKNRNGFHQQQNNVFNTLLYLSGHFRGRDGVGVVAVDNIGNVKLAKAAYTVDEFIRTKEYDDLEKETFQKGWAMFGHNRAATRGVVSDENSHPFVADDNIILVHNGTFQGDHKKLKDTEVDSEAIAHTLADTSQTTEEALRKINAAYALIWYNVAKKELNVVRNTQRPLWYMETSDSYIYASEESFLEFVKKKFNLTVRRDPFEIKEYNLARYFLNDKNECEMEFKDIDSSYWKHQPTGGASSTGAPFPKSTSETSVGEDNYRRHALACAWGAEHNGWLGEDLDGFDVALAAHQPAPPVIINTKTSDSTRRVMECLQNTIKKVTYADWNNLNKRYMGTQTLRVLVNDLVEADDRPKTDRFLLIGKTLDENRLQVVFPMRGVEFEKVLELTKDAIFEIEFSGITWHSMEEEGSAIKDIDNIHGLALMHGLNAQPIYVSNDAHPVC